LDHPGKTPKIEEMIKLYFRHCIVLFS